ncbi:Coiled-coil domain-containing protein, partial [Pseudocercospora fuligena]
MAKGGGENSKKAQGQARKAEAAQGKKDAENAKKAAEEAKKWDKGAKDNSKAKGGKGKAAPAKKSRGLDLSGLDAPSSKKELALNATGIDNALDALSLTTDNKDKIDRHPERRFKAAYAAYEDRRLDEMKDEKGLRRQQKIDQIRKEFEKHPDNPFNQVAGSYNMSKEEMNELRDSEKAKKEAMLTGQ